jgi:acetyl-CoA carboxylase carboxyltransferase component
MLSGLEDKMNWQKEIDELRNRKRLAKQMGGTEGIARQHSRGRLTVRERIDLLLDPGSFQEIGTFAGEAEYDNKNELQSFTHAPRVAGYGRISGRPVCLQGGDFTIRGGWADPTSFVDPGGFSIEKMSLEWRIPFIRLLDSAGGSVLRIKELGRTVLLGNPDRWGIPASLMAQVPVISAALGSLGGAPPVEVAASHWNIMTKNTSQLCVAGPPLIKQAMGIDIKTEELGGYKVHAYQSGLIDNVAEDERDAFRQIRLFLSYLPQNVWQQPPRVENKDDPNRRAEELLSIIPRDRTAGCEKMTRFVDFADTFHLPLIYLLDNPGFMIGPESEKEGIERKSARLAIAVTQLTVPVITVILRRCYGVAGALHGSMSSLNLRYAWPSAEWGSLPIEGGVMAAYRREIEAAPNPGAKLLELEQSFAKFRSPFRTAEAFGVEEIIDPRDTRPLLCEFVTRAQDVTATQLGPKSRVGMRP